MFTGSITVGSMIKLTLPWYWRLEPLLRNWKSLAGHTPTVILSRVNWLFNFKDFTFLEVTFMTPPSEVRGIAQSNLSFGPSSVRN